jgi:hypothetical protein
MTGGKQVTPRLNKVFLSKIQTLKSEHTGIKRYWLKVSRYFGNA